MTLTRLRVAVAGLLLTCAANAPAQTAPAPAPSAAAVYEDRLIEGGRLQSSAPEFEDQAYDAQGWPRAVRIDAVVTNIHNSRGGTTEENGFVLSGRLDTPTYGSVSLDGTIRTQPSGGVFTLLQRGVPFEGGWIANNGFGMFNTPGIDLSRSQYRFYLPTFPVAGAATEWFWRDNLQLQASIGEPGIFNGLRLPGFTRLGGTVTSLGAQWNATPQWQAGMQFTDVRNVDLAVAGGGDPTNVEPTSISGRSWFGSAAWQGESTRLQLNVLDSQVANSSNNLGFWLDGWTRDGRYTHNYGGFRLDPNLAWGYIPVASDLAGGYYRVYYQSQQWTWDAGVDAITSVSGAGIDAALTSGSVRYQIDRSLGIGGGAAYRHAGRDAGSGFVFFDKQSAFGSTRVQVDAAGEAGDRSSAAISYDQTWPVPVGARLTTSLATGYVAGDGERVNQTSVGVLGSSALGNNVTLDGNVRWIANSGSVNASGTYANVNLTWRIDARWSLATTYYENRAVDRQVVGLAPIIPVGNAIATTSVRESAWFVVLRFEERAGSASGVLGGAPGTGAGNVVGYVFLDSNDDGRRDASDEGAANVTVLLDGRFSVRTDRDGRFEFPLVASGTHTVTVVPDNLPLPWAVSEGGKRSVQVRTRETAELAIGARRLK